MSFGDALRELRTNAGMRQQDLADRLGGRVARSTLSNVESGRQPAPERLWAAIADLLPDWLPVLQEAEHRSWEAARQGQRAASGDPRNLLGGPFHLESVGYTYVFREHRSPEEVLEVRRVRALTDGADGYGLRMRKTDGTPFDVDQESLWGGHLEEVAGSGAAAGEVVRRFAFDRGLRAGEVHEFALRTWIERDPEPGTAVVFDFTIPVSRAQLNLTFLGPRPSAFWEFDGEASGPDADPETPPDDPSDPAWLQPASDGMVTRAWQHPRQGVELGIGWSW